jgi:hypothetical protein
MRLCCSICLYVADGEAPRAVTVINGHATCEEHASDAQGSTEHGQVIAAVRKRVRLQPREGTLVEPPASALGHAEISGMEVPLAGIELSLGHVTFLFRLAGPVAAAPEEPRDLVIYGDDGTRVTAGRVNLGWEQVKAGDVLSLTVSTDMIDARGDAEEGDPGGQAG